MDQTAFDNPLSIAVLKLATIIFGVVCLILAGVQREFLLILEEVFPDSFHFYYDLKLEKNAEYLLLGISGGSVFISVLLLVLHLFHCISRRRVFKIINIFYHCICTVIFLLGGILSYFTFTNIDSEFCDQIHHIFICKNELRYELKIATGSFAVLNSFVFLIAIVFLAKDFTREIHII